MVIEPVLAIPAFVPTEYDTVPFPEPELPELTDIQLLLLTAVQLQPEAVITFTLPDVPPEGTLACPGAERE